MEEAMQNFIKALGEFVKISADLADTGRMIRTDAARADDITAGVKRRESGHIEFSLFTKQEGRV